jgi:hypothetical protein
MTSGSIAELVAKYRRLSQPDEDPDREVRERLRHFFSHYLRSKGRAGGTTEEATERLHAAQQHTPRAWPEDPARLARLLDEVISDPDRLPRLSPRAQLVWLGFEAQCDPEVIDAALHRAFPATTPTDIAAAYKESSDHSRSDIHGMRVVTAAFQAWHDIEAGRGRAKVELVFGAFIDELDLLDNGRVELNRLQRVTDPEMRQATIAAAWEADQPDDPEATEPQERH